MASDLGRRLPLLDKGCEATLIYHVFSGRKNPQFTVQPGDAEYEDVLVGVNRAFAAATHVPGVPPKSRGPGQSAWLVCGTAGGERCIFTVDLSSRTIERSGRLGGTWHLDEDGFRSLSDTVLHFRERTRGPGERWSRR